MSVFVACFYEWRRQSSGGVGIWGQDLSGRPVLSAVIDLSAEIKDLRRGDFVFITGQTPLSDAEPGSTSPQMVLSTCAVTFQSGSILIAALMSVSATSGVIGCIKTIHSWARSGPAGERKIS